MTVDDLWRALALMGVFEGVLYALFPAGVKRMMDMARNQPDDTLRLMGLMIASLSVACLWLLRG